MDAPGESTSKGSAAPRDRRLPRCRRIAESPVFRQAFETAAPFAGGLMVLRRCPGSGSGLRLGVVVSKRTLRRAVDRNRAKRLLREAFRLNRDKLQGDADLVIVARQRIAGATRGDVEHELLKLARGAGLMGGKSHAG